jgi:FixJ family two-component response regulator
MAIHDPEDSKRRRVLLVEDDAAVRRSLQLLLVAQGYDVRAYPSAAGLAQDPQALSADCLVADLVIRDGNAVTLLSDLRGSGFEGPAILISGHLTNEWAERALASGYAATFAKPIGDSVLTKCLERLIPPAGGGPRRPS